MISKLERMRRQCGLSKSDLAIKSGVSRLTIWKIETGHPQRYQARTLRKIADALGCEASDIFNLEKMVL